MRSFKSISVILTVVMMVLCLSAATSFAGRNKVSAEDVAALQKIGIDLSSSSAEEIEKKAIAIERLVNAIKGLAEARTMEAKARKEEAAAAKAELKLKMDAEKARMKLERDRQKIADKKARAEQKRRDDSFVGGLLNGIGSETQKGAKKGTKTAINELLEDIFK